MMLGMKVPNQSDEKLGGKHYQQVKWTAEYQGLKDEAVEMRSQPKSMTNFKAK